ncbi:MAG: RNA polymerase sigma factor [Deltaproteobacteria bacterium]|nr:RNA polymerase sigma factor [Deltaproteobacteria bacterium]
MSKSELEFIQIYDIFQPRVSHYLTRMVGKQEAEDLTQDVFMKINQNLKNFRGESELSTWIYRIATNTALDRLRGRSLNQMPLNEPILNDSKEMILEDRDVWAGEGKPSNERHLIRKEMNECIRNIVSHLPEDYRTIISLSELQGLSNKEIAGLLGISLNTVKIRLHRARLRLRKELETCCVFYRDKQNEFSCEPKETRIFGGSL